jgi:hypothetical protein
MDRVHALYALDSDHLPSPPSYPPWDPQYGLVHLAAAGGRRDGEGAGALVAALAGYAWRAGHYEEVATAAPPTQGGSGLSLGPDTWGRVAAELSSGEVGPWSWRLANLLLWSLALPGYRTHPTDGGEPRCFPYPLEPRGGGPAPAERAGRDWIRRQGTRTPRHWLRGASGRFATGTGASPAPGALPLGEALPDIPGYPPPRNPPPLIPEPGRSGAAFREIHQYLTGGADPADLPGITRRLSAGAYSDSPEAWYGASTAIGAPGRALSGTVGAGSPPGTVDRDLYLYALSGIPTLRHAMGPGALGLGAWVR